MNSNSREAYRVENRGHNFQLETKLYENRDEMGLLVAAKKYRHDEYHILKSSSTPHRQLNHSKNIHSYIPNIEKYRITNQGLEKKIKRRVLMICQRNLAVFNNIRTELRTNFPVGSPG